jgi:beta-phosphoglucomutase
MSIGGSILIQYASEEESIEMHSTEVGGIIWDLDGTLVDTSELHFHAWTALARELQRPLSRQAFEATFGRRNPEIIRDLFGHDLSDEEVNRLGDRKEELYRNEAQHGTDLLPGARSLLQELQSNGFKQAIGSSAPRANIDLIMDLTRTKRYFSVVVSMEDTQRGKPDPQVFQIAAERLGVQAERCLVIEDAAAGVQAAKAGRMKCIAVRAAGHHPEDSLRRAGADLVVETLESLSIRAIREVMSR